MPLGIWGSNVLSWGTTRRDGVATYRAGLSAALVVAGTLIICGCSYSSGVTAGGAAEASATPPAPTGTWAPADATAEPGPATPAPLPTETARIDQPVVFGSGVTVSVRGVDAVSVKAETPGEVSGAAVRVTLTVKNDTTQPLDLGSAVVTLTADHDGFGVGTTAGGAQPFTGTVAPGGAADATYVFMLDPAQGRAVTVSVNYAAGEPVAVFSGKTA